MARKSSVTKTNECTFSETHLKIDTKTTRTSRRDEAENLVVRVEPFGQDLTLFNLGRSIKSKVTMSLVGKEFFENVEDFRHLRKDENSVTSSLALS